MAGAPLRRSIYETPRARVAETLRGVLAFPAISVVDAELAQRAVEVYDVHRLDFADAYLVACAERSGIGVVASFDRSIDRVGTVKRGRATLTVGTRRSSIPDSDLATLTGSGAGK
jgi:predicted nucleic acid-binding protein